MDPKVFKRIQDINTEGWDNSVWEILHSDDDKHTADYFGAARDQVLPEGDYIAIWLERGSSKRFVARNAEICFSVITLLEYDARTTVYIYKV